MQPHFFAKIGVSEGGYEWWNSGKYRIAASDEIPTKRGPREKHRRLQVRPIGEEGALRFRSYDPFSEQPALFLELAELEATEDAIARFTEQYGPLWFDEYGGPSLIEWKHAIGELRAAVDLWKAINSADRDKLAEFVSWDRAGNLRWKTQLARPVEWDGKTYHLIDVTPGNKTFGRDDLLGPATKLLDFVISDRSNWDLSIQPHRRSGVLELRFVVQTLHSVLWVQFCLAVLESKRYGRCELCDRPFELDSTRADRTFCSDNCRVKAYKRRRKHAIKLHEAGKPLGAIVKAVGSERKIVAKWIKPKEN